ncbi:MAG TPA: hypothetical protein VFH66_08895 [Mycobacteriales bacterium]|nr:hypothetical protein [Mycobacteriales bacterium]
MHTRTTRRRGLALLTVPVICAVSAALTSPPAWAATTWTQQAELTASDHAGYQFYGTDVDYDGTTAIIGSDANAAPGEAWIYTVSGSTWTEDAILTESAASRCFGNAVAVSGATAIVTDPCYGSDAAAYVFTKSGGTWSKTATLTVPDGNYFGSSVALEGGTAVIANNATNPEAYVFTMSRKGVWSQSATLTPTVSSNVTLGSFGGYAPTIALSGSTVVIGAPDSNVGSDYNNGAAYVFRAKGKRWSQVAELTGSASADAFGSAVATDGSTVVIGASGASKAYIYSVGRRGLSLATTLTGTSGDTFGFAVGVDGPNVIVGARDGNTAYAYTSADSWANAQTLTPDSTYSPYEFGSAVAIHGATAFIGADDTTIADSAEGSAYVFTLA